jgi:hypothetical protein
VFTGDSPAWAQRIAAKAEPRPAESVPALTGVSPPGAVIGATTEWTISGRNLTSVERFHVSGKGVEIAEVKSKSAGTAVLAVRAAADAEPGFRELRAEAPDGYSNLLVVRVDRLAQTAETEPNDDPAKANDLAIGAAAVGVIKPQDIDHFRIKGRAGQRITIDVEAQRLGTAIAPVVTITTAEGGALAQAREGRGGDHDCRLPFTLPRTGSYIIQLRDNVYGGNDAACYRLRVVDAPFATGMFPLGGQRGQSITVTASGGNLARPRTKTVTLPNEPGLTVEAGVFDGPGGPVIAPARLFVGDGPEIFEARADSAGRSTTPLALGTTANGRLESPGEVDRYEITLKKGERVRVKVQAGALGSWLDSVLVLRDPRGQYLEENDDQTPDAQRGGGVLGLPEAPPDSALDYTAKEDGKYIVEVADRYGEGGPEYGYRLSAGPPSPDFSIALLLGNPVINRQLAALNRRAGAPGPGANGAFNFRPGSTTPINFLITPEGRPGPIVVSMEGLPDGIVADPVTVRLPTAPRTPRPGAALSTAPVGGALIVKVAPNAEPVTSVIRVVATGKRDDGTTIRRFATASVAIDLSAEAGGGGQTPVPLRLLTSLPVKVVGVSRPVVASNNAGGPRRIRLSGITVPGALLQGGWLELGLSFDPPDAKAKEFKVSAEAAAGKVTVSKPAPPSLDTTDARLAVRVQAAIDAPPGVATVRIRFQEPNQAEQVFEVPVIIRAPVRITARPEPIMIGPNGTAELWVGVEREGTYSGPVELRVTGLPDGVRAPGRFVVPPGESGGVVRLVSPKRAKPIGPGSAVRVSGVVRMVQGAVSVDSAIRPMVVGRTAEE